MDNNKTELVAFRLTPAERRELASAAASASMSESQYIRALLSGRTVQLVQLPIDGARLDEVNHELKKSGTNLNQIAYRLNRSDNTALAEVADVLAAHRAAAKNLSDLIDETRPKC